MHDVSPLARWQSYQKVPETPLASCNVLKEDAEVWVDVQVSTTSDQGVVVVDSFDHFSLRTHNSSLESAMKLKFVPFCSS